MSTASVTTPASGPRPSLHLRRILSAVVVFEDREFYHLPPASRPHTNP